MVLDLERDIVKEINKYSKIIAYDLPYVLKTDRMENLITLVENAPTAYSIEIKESPCYPGGIFLLFKCLE